LSRAICASSSSSDSRKSGMFCAGRAMAGLAAKECLLLSVGILCQLYESVNHILGGKFVKRDASRHTRAGTACGRGAPPATSDNANGRTNSRRPRTSRVERRGTSPAGSRVRHHNCSLRARSRYSASADRHPRKGSADARRRRRRVHRR
jgi:hypothetical protein